MYSFHITHCKQFVAFNYVSRLLSIIHSLFGEQLGFLLLINNASVNNLSFFMTHARVSLI